MKSAMQDASPASQLQQKQASVKALLDQSESLAPQLVEFIDRLVFELERRRAAVAMEVGKWRGVRDKVRDAALASPATVLELCDTEALLDSALSEQSDWAVGFDWDEAKAEAMADELLRVLKVRFNRPSASAVAAAAPSAAKPSSGALPVSGAYLAGCNFSLEQPSGTVKVFDAYAAKTAAVGPKNLKRDLTVTRPDNSAVNLGGAVCIRACEETQLLLILIKDPDGCSVAACHPDGRLEFGIGPGFSCDYNIGEAEDLVSTGRLLVICSPEHGLLLAPMAKPSGWGTVIANGSTRPVRLAWSRQLNALILANQVSKDQYMLYAFDVGFEKKAKSASLSLRLSSSDRLLSTSRPCLLPSNEGLLVSVFCPQGAKIMLFSSDFSNIIRTIRMNCSRPVIDMCWLGGSRLAVYTDKGGMFKPSCGRTVRPENFQSAKPAAEPAEVALAGAVSAAYLSGLRFVLELTPTSSYSVRVLDSDGYDLPDACLKFVDEAGSELSTSIKRPLRIRSCSRHSLLILTDPQAETVLVFSPEGRLRFSVGPRFSTSFPLSKPSDAISTGDLLVVCSPDKGLFMVSLATPNKWRTTVKKQAYKLRQPVRLGWDASRQLLIVVDEVTDQSYSVFTFTIGTFQIGANLHLQAAFSDPIRSLAIPSVLSSDNGSFLLSVLTEDGPRLLTADSSAVRNFHCRLPANSGPVTDLCWIGDALWLCCDGQFIKVDY